MENLIYVVGASGAGKDSVMETVKKRIWPGTPLVFAHRYITRPASMGGENYISLSETEFHLRKKAGFFSMDWHSHGYYYGLGIEINMWLHKGFSVVVNGSREYLPTASAIYPNMKVCLIQVSKDILVERLTKRGRETPKEIRKRLERADSFQVSHPNLFTINNDYTLEESADQFINSFLKQFQSSSLA